MLLYKSSSMVFFECVGHRLSFTFPISANRLYMSSLWPVISCLVVLNFFLTWYIHNYIRQAIVNRTMLVSSDMWLLHFVSALLLWYNKAKDTSCKKTAWKNYEFYNLFTRFTCRRSVFHKNNLTSIRREIWQGEAKEEQVSEKGV